MSETENASANAGVVEREKRRISGEVEAHFCMFHLEVAVIQRNCDGESRLCVSRRAGTSEPGNK